MEIKENEVLQALECHKNKNCTECPYKMKACSDTLFTDSLTVIYNLKKKNAQLKTAISEARKEFVERLEDKMFILPYDGRDCIVVPKDDINNLLQEMEGNKT